MFRFVLALAATLFLLGSGSVPAQTKDGPPISITSPDEGTTYAFGTLKSRSLFWNEKEKVLVAQVSFIDEHDDGAQSNADVHSFRLPGITFDQGKGTFFATTAKGVLIPVAKIKKALFIRSVAMLPNARVRVLHPRGQITVILEAISPDDPAMRPAPANGDPDAVHKVDTDKLFN